MDLHGLASGAINSVNPFVDVVIRVSTGYTKDASYKQVPTYADAITRSGQVQPLSTGDLRHLDALNIQGVERVIYIAGAYKAVVRSDAVGGDLVTLPDGTQWLVTAVFEQWPDWCRIGVTRQNP